MCCKPRSYANPKRIAVASTLQSANSLRIWDLHLYSLHTITRLFSVKGRAVRKEYLML
jgi:hypothetical protein